MKPLLLSLLGLALAGFVHGGGDRESAQASHGSDFGPCNNDVLCTDDVLRLLFNCVPGHPRTWTDNLGNKLVVTRDPGDGTYTATWFDQNGRQINVDHFDGSHCPFGSFTVQKMFSDCGPPPGYLDGNEYYWKNDLDSMELDVHCDINDNNKYRVEWYDSSELGGMRIGGEETFNSLGCPVDARPRWSNPDRSRQRYYSLDYPCGSPYLESDYDNWTSQGHPIQNINFAKDGARSVTSYDKHGNVIKVEEFDASGCPTKTDTFVYQYGTHGPIFWDGTVHWDGSGQLVVVDKNGQLVPVHYDEKGRLVDGSGHLVDLYYDRNGQLVNDNGQLVDETGDPLTDSGRLKEEIISDQYYPCDHGECGALNRPPVASRVTHKTPRPTTTVPPGPIPITTFINTTTAVWIYDPNGHVVSVTTFDGQGRAKRSDARAPAGQSGQAGSPDSGSASGGTAGVATGAASTSPVPSHLHPGAKWHQNLTGGNTDASATQNTSAGSTNSSSGQTGAGSKNQIIWQKPSSAATNLGTSSTGGNSATGGTAGVANGLSAQSDAENQRKIIWQKSSSGGATSSVTTTTSSGSASTRRKSQSKRSVSASSNANIQGSGQPAGKAHPTPTPTSRKKKPGTDVQNEH